MNITHFTDDRIAEVRSGRSPLTPEERAFLLEDTPRFEECDEKPEVLAAMSDRELMGFAYGCWADYVSGQL